MSILVSVAVMQGHSVLDPARHGWIRGCTGSLLGDFVTRGRREDIHSLGQSNTSGPVHAGCDKREKDAGNRRSQRPGGQRRGCAHRLTGVESLPVGKAHFPPLAAIVLRDRT